MDYSFFNVSVNLTDAGHGGFLYSLVFYFNIPTEACNNLFSVDKMVLV